MAIRSKVTVLTETHLLDHESPVQSGLSLTPAQVFDLALSGRPVNPPVVDEALFIDSDNTPDYDYSVGAEYQRSVTMSQAWEMEHDSKTKIRKAEKLALKNLASTKGQKGVSNANT